MAKIYNIGIMKYSVIILLLGLLFSCKKTNPQLTMQSYIYDYGYIKNDSLYNGSVILKNVGGSPLIIENVSADCGCTNVSLSKNKIEPEDTCLLSFTYNSFYKEGKQENYIFITTNTDSLIHALQINAYVK
jgi:hypothetical protein